MRSFEWEKEESGDGGAGSGPMDNTFVSDLVNKAKTETPFVGLLVKLLSPQGVKGQLTYQEFSRVIYDNVSSQFHIVSLLPTSSFSFFFRFMQFHSLYLTTFSLLSTGDQSCENTEKKFGEMAGIRGCIYCLWVACFGTGKFEKDELQELCARVRLESDLVFLVETFELKRDDALKYQQNQNQGGKVTAEEKVSTAVNNLIGLWGGSGIDKETQYDMYEIVSACFPSSEPSFVKNIIQKHPKVLT